MHAPDPRDILRLADFRSTLGLQRAALFRELGLRRVVRHRLGKDNVHVPLDALRGRDCPLHRATPHRLSRSEIPPVSEHPVRAAQRRIHRLGRERLSLAVARESRLLFPDSGLQHGVVLLGVRHLGGLDERGHVVAQQLALRVHARGGALLPRGHEHVVRLRGTPLRQHRRRVLGLQRRQEVPALVQRLLVPHHSRLHLIQRHPRFARRNRGHPRFARGKRGALAGLERRDGAPQAFLEGLLALGLLLALLRSFAGRLLGRARRSGGGAPIREDRGELLEHAVQLRRVGRPAPVRLGVDDVGLLLRRREQLQRRVPPCRLIRDRAVVEQHRGPRLQHRRHLRELALDVPGRSHPARLEFLLAEIEREGLRRRDQLLRLRELLGLGRLGHPRELARRRFRDLRELLRVGVSHRVHLHPVRLEGELAGAQLALQVADRAL
mmetsp:Transcript_65333/g.155818  ORF Transcript_65333/g.155818 Transcript_65333/m.155818 type:complete len:438 (+) Transcript_65333:382-1695(+)